MANRRIALIQGHPDPDGGHLDHALADAWATGAEAAGHRVDRIAVAELDFPLLRRPADFEHGEPPAPIAAAQETLMAADHWTLVFPLWLGGPPALLKGFLEQTLRPGFFHPAGGGHPLRGRSARLVVTMGMPATVYRLWFHAHGVRMVERSILRFAGLGPVRTTLLGLVERPRARARWLQRMERQGRRGR